MKLRRTFHFSPILFGFIPLLNVLFLVIVFWMTGSKFIMQPGVQVTLPPTTFALGPQRNAEIVSVTTGITEPAIYFRGRKVTENELSALFAQNHAPDRTIIVKADKFAPSWQVHKIMHEAQLRGFTVIWAGAYQQE